VVAPPNPSQDGVFSVGRIQYRKYVTPPAKPLFGYEYVGMRLRITNVGGDVTDATSPGWANRLWAKAAFNQTDSVFVGLRFTNGPFDLVDSGQGDGTTVSAVPFFTIMRAARSDGAATQPETSNGNLVLGPRQIGSGDVVLQLAVKWGTETDTKIPAVAIQAVKTASQAYNFLPAMTANSLVNIKNSDRSAANEFFNRALSSSSVDLQGSNGPSGVNSETISNAELRSGVSVEVSVFDKDARAADKQEIVHFILSPEYRSSIIPNSSAEASADKKTMYVYWTSGAYRGPVMTGNLDSTGAKLLARLPQVGPLLVSQLETNATFGDTCAGLLSDYAQLGFNEGDQNAMAWSQLQDSRVLKLIPLLNADIAKGIFQTQTPCPDDRMKASFADWGLPYIANQIDLLPGGPSGGSLKDQRFQVLKYPFARAWARQESFDALFDPKVNMVTIDDTGIVNIMTPAKSDDLITGLKTIVPTSVGMFSLLMTRPDTFCSVFTVRSKKYKGAIDFVSNSTSIDTIHVGGPTDCPAPQ